jgi:hypothetical protein
MTAGRSSDLLLGCRVSCFSYDKSLPAYPFNHRPAQSVIAVKKSDWGDSSKAPKLKYSYKQRESLEKIHIYPVTY